MVPHQAGDELEFSARLIHGYSLCPHLVVYIEYDSWSAPYAQFSLYPSLYWMRRKSRAQEKTVAAVRTEKEQGRLELRKVGPTHKAHTRTPFRLDSCRWLQATGAGQVAQEEKWGGSRPSDPQLLTCWFLPHVIPLSYQRAGPAGLTSWVPKL